MLGAAPLKVATDKVTAYAEGTGCLEGTVLKFAVIGERGAWRESFTFVYLLICHDGETFK